MDFSDFRAEFPVLERVVYLNTGTDGPVPRRAYEAARAQMAREMEDGRVGKPFFEALLAAGASLRERLAAALGCDAADVALTHSTTDGVSTALSALPLGLVPGALKSGARPPGLPPSALRR